MEGEGAVFIPCRTGRGLGWRAGDHWLCQCEVEGAAISTTGGSVCTITTGQRVFWTSAKNGTTVMSNCQGASGFKL